MTLVKAGSQQRGVYNKILADYPGLNPAMGFLRSEVTLENGVNQYVFSLLRDNNAQSGRTEEKLAFNDAFVITHLGLAAVMEDTAAPGTHIPYFYPNSFEFTIGNVNPQHLEALWQGKLKITVNETVFVPSIDTRRFRCVTGIQKSSATNQDEQDYARTMIAQTPSITLFGNQKAETVLTIPTFGTQAIQNTDSATATRKTKVVLLAAGFLVQGGSLGKK